MAEILTVIFTPTVKIECRKSFVEDKPGSAQLRNDESDKVLQ